MLKKLDSKERMLVAKGKNLLKKKMTPVQYEATEKLVVLTEQLMSMKKDDPHSQYWGTRAVICCLEEPI